MSEKKPTAILASLATLLPELVAVYKDIHAHPELSMHETRTAQIAADHLKAIGFEVTTGIGKTGVVGILRNGDGPTVMLRADMDALPIEEATGLSYASTVTGTDPSGKTVPVAHSCRARYARCLLDWRNRSFCKEPGRVERDTDGGLSARRGNRARC